MPRSMLLMAACWALAVGCAPMIHHDAQAVSTAVSSARYEFGCQEVTGEKISRVTQKNAWQSSKSIDSFKIGVAGCGKSDVIAVECGVREDSGCEFQDAQRIKQRDLK